MISVCLVHNRITLDKDDTNFPYFTSMQSFIVTLIEACLTAQNVFFPYPSPGYLPTYYLTSKQPFIVNKGLFDWIISARVFFLIDIYQHVLIFLKCATFRSTQQCLAETIVENTYSQ
jgi:hypothetical protein